MRDFLRKVLTGPDNQTYDIARVAFGAVIAGWFLALLTFLILETWTVFASARAGASVRPLEGFSSGVVALFSTLSVVNVMSAWAIKMKADTEPAAINHG